MMIVRRWFLGLFLLLPAFLLATILVRGAPGDFVIENADQSQFLTLGGSTTLGSLLKNVSPRVAIQYANAVRHLELTSPSGQLTNRLESIGPRFVIQYANENQILNIAYPNELINDEQPPVAGKPTVSMLGGDSVLIRWTTDEYATTQVDLGTQPGQYSKQYVDSLYKKLHEVQVTDLEAGKTYYFRTSNSDRSGNTVRSQEQKLEVVEQIIQYLPMIQRN